MKVASVQDSIVTALRESRKARAVKAAEAPAEPHRAITFKAMSVDEHGVIVGIGGAAGSPDKLDLDGEFVEKGDLMKMAFDFCGSSERIFKANHDDDATVDAQLVESWVGAPIVETSDGVRALKASEDLTQDMVVKGISFDEPSHWFVAIRPEDASIVAAAKKGDIAGFSWGGLVNKTKV